MRIPPSYELIRREKIEEIDAEALTLRHVKSGAHLILLDCADINKVFTIAFKTPPLDDTGAAHILEHSVLCGSERFPCRDPFVELAKGSMNTFLNAMTYPEKTLYPVASCNDRDFENLMSVYMDAVFHPNIYRNELIFLQEGWHYELENAESELTVNGVVYNEMKGAFSDPTGLLDSYSQTVLFKDTPYAKESGGRPEQIPTLTYEAFLDFHRRYYHPGNSYIYLYGRMDFEEKLNWLDEHYLGSCDTEAPVVDVPKQAPFSEMARETLKYGISEGEDENECIFSWSKVTGDQADPVEALAFEVLGYALLNAPGAPIRQSLLEAGIGAEVYGGFDSSVRQTVFGVIAKGAEHEQLGEFEEIIDRELLRAATEGIPEKTLLAGIHNIEFNMREADFGRYPRGLIYGMQIYDTWIHDEEKAFVHLKYNESFKKLRALIGQGYFEELIRTRLIENRHGAVIEVRPELGYTDAKEQETRERLAALKAQMTPGEIASIVEKTAALKRWQSEPEDPELLKCVPMISVSDISREVAPFTNEEREIDGIRTVFHDIETSGIGYLDIYLPIGQIGLSDFPYLALLKNYLGILDTAHFGYRELSDEISLYTGGMSSSVTTITDRDDHRLVREYFIIRTRMIYDNTAEAVRLLKEVFFGTRFENTARMKEIIGEIRSDMSDGLVSSGDSTVLKRVLSYVSASAAEDDLISGIGFYDFLCDLEKNFETRKEDLVRKMEELRRAVFLREGMIISYTGREEGYEKLAAALPAFTAGLSAEPRVPASRDHGLSGRNEGFKTASQVQYVAAGGNFRAYGHEFTGAMRVLRKLLGYDYLWNRLRVQGGAYGCMSFFGRNGEMAFVSYRDPNLKETIRVYEEIPAYLEQMTIEARDMEKYIIGTISESDYPLLPRALGRRSMSALLTGVTIEQIRAEREEVLNCTAEDLKALVPVIRDVLSGQYRCAIGAEAKIESEREIFEAVRPLTGESHE